MERSRILITGVRGFLGPYLFEAARTAGFEPIGWAGPSPAPEPLASPPFRSLDLTAPPAVAAAFRADRPSCVVHAAALARVADCSRDPDRARAVNTTATAFLAQLASEAGCRFLHVSTDLVFDGQAAPYREESPPNPLSVYGKTKAAAEEAVLRLPGTVVVRVSLLFGPGRPTRPSFLDQQCNTLASGQSLGLFADEWRSPIDARTAATGLIALAAVPAVGLLHLGGPERLSRLAMGQRLAAVLGVDPALVYPTSRTEAPGEPRPRDTTLDSSRWRLLFPHLPWPSFDDALRTLLPSPVVGGPDLNRR